MYKSKFLKEKERRNNLTESYTKSRYALRYDKDGMAQGSGFNNLNSALDFVHSNNINNFSIHKNPFNQTADEKNMLVFGLGDNYWMAQAYKKLLTGDVSLSKKADLKSTPLKFYYYTDFKNGYKQVKFTLKDFLSLM